MNDGGQMEITLVKCLSDGTTIGYSEVNVNSPEHTVLPACPDRRNADFETAMKALKTLGANLLGQDPKVWTATGVTVKKSELGKRSFHIHGSLKTNVGPTVLGVPKMSASVDGETGENVLSKKQLAVIDKVLSEAGDYIRGEREQLTLPLDGSEDDGEEPAGVEAAGGQADGNDTGSW